MAVSVTSYRDPVINSAHYAIGDRRITFGDLTLDASYPTGGYAVDRTTFGFAQQLDFLVLGGVGIAGAKIVAFDRANSKVKVFSAIGTEASNGSDQSAVVLPFAAIGK